jgi:hypothetical protein
MIQLETYHGTKSRHTCPGCNSRHCFVRYVGDDGNYLSTDVGRCNRESKCGFHKKPKEYFAEQPQNKNADFKKSKKRSNSNYGFAQKQPRQNFDKVSQADYIAPEHLKPTLGNYDRNNFVQFLFDLFPDCGDEIQAVLKMYFVGTYQDYTCFPSIDRLNRVCRAKLIRFDEKTGKRHKGDYDTSSLPAKLKLKEDFQYKQIFFGEHLLPKFPNKPVAIVEAEKTAIVASLCFPEFVWLACNSKSWLKAERIKRLGNRQIILYPDADGFDLWQGIASEARTQAQQPKTDYMGYAEQVKLRADARNLTYTEYLKIRRLEAKKQKNPASARTQGLTVKVSSLIETHATDEQRANGFDLADFLINEQTEINQFNNFVDRYNAKLEMVLNDESLLTDFETILDERKAIAIYNGESETEAERICRQPENLRSVALSL